jgi:hypothetical protein
VEISDALVGFLNLKEAISLNRGFEFLEMFSGLRPRCIAFEDGTEIWESGVSHRDSDEVRSERWHYLRCPCCK